MLNRAGFIVLGIGIIVFLGANHMLLHAVGKEAGEFPYSLSGFAAFLICVAGLITLVRLRKIFGLILIFLLAQLISGIFLPVYDNIPLEAFSDKDFENYYLLKILIHGLGISAGLWCILRGMIPSAFHLGRTQENE